MAPDPFATPADVAARWRPLTPAEEELAVTLVEDASAILRAKYPDVDARITTGDLAADNAVQVVAGMVKRALLAPADGVDSTSETVGPFSYSTRYANAMQALFTTVADDLLIRGYRPRAVSMRFV